MKSVGIICEYNPFHNGHLYHLKKIKEKFPDYIVVLVLSPTFSQRGEASIINKWDKTKLSLDNGVDLVIELPYPFACQSADFFAEGAIKILNYLKVEYLVFGSESNNVELLTSLADTQLHNKNYDCLVKKHMDNGNNYPTAMSNALKEITGNTVTLPNDLLGVSYIKKIIELDSKIKPLTIKRTNNYHGNNENSNIISAQEIRNKIINKENITKFIPKYDNILFNTNSYFKYLKYKILIEGKQINKYQTVEEGIENRINKFILESNTLEELINKVKTKRYTYNKLNRMFNHILCGFTKEEANSMKNITYIRVLGFNKNGKEYLNNNKKNINIPIITNCKNIDDRMLLLEHRVANIYNLINNINDNEILRKPIIHK